MTKLQQILSIIATMTLVEFRQLLGLFGLSSGNFSSYVIQDLFSGIDNLPRVSPPMTSYGLEEVTVWESGLNGKKIQAIKLHREHFGSGLREAKDAIDGLQGNKSWLSLGNYPPYLCKAIKDHWAESGVNVVIGVVEQPHEEEWGTFPDGSQL